MKKIKLPEELENWIMQSPNKDALLRMKKSNRKLSEIESWIKLDRSICGWMNGFINRCLKRGNCQN